MHGICHLDLEKEDLKSDRPHFTVNTYLDYIDERKQELINKHDIELAEYYLDHFQYFQSLTLKE